MKWAVRSLADLGPGLVLAPERHVVTELAGAGGRALEELALERIERVSPREIAEGEVVVLDTTHAKDGVLDVPSARLASESARSTKKRALPGDLLVSRLRPYLRQIALVHPSALPKGVALAVSTEFYVLAPRVPAESLAWLVPWLLSEATQEALAAGQEGGHHPRVPRDSLFALRVPTALHRGRARASARVEAALREHYAASARLRRVLALR